MVLLKIFEFEPDKTFKWPNEQSAPCGQNLQFSFKFKEYVPGEQSLQYVL